MIGPEDMSPEKGGLGEVFFKRLNGRADQNYEFMVDLNDKVSLSFKDILQYSINLTLNLENLGLRKDEVVGLLADNCWHSTIILLACWNIGAPVALLNPNFAKNELQNPLTSMEPKFLFTTKSKLAVLEYIKCPSLERVILLDTQAANGYLCFPSLLFHTNMTYQGYKHKKINPKETIACILSSSGTTGLPKAVLLSHENLKFATKILTHPDAMDINEKTVTILYLPMFHIMGTMTFLASVAIGKKIIIINRFKSDLFLAAIQEYKVNKLFVVPPILQFFVKNRRCEEYDLSSIQHLLSGGAPASRDLEKDVSKKLKNAKVRQIYGMTEVSGAVTVVPLRKPRMGSVGKIVEGLELKIIDPATRKCLEPFARGEICIKGPQVMIGYLKNEEETKKTIDEEGFIHSGDIGYVDKDGFLFIVDRIKELIKYKAFQVPPAELESVIITHPAVKDVGVVGKPDDRCGELPTAFVVKMSGQNISERDICDFVAENLSSEKHLHGGVVFIDEIPKTASGKILRKDLKKMLQN